MSTLVRRPTVTGELIEKSVGALIPEKSPNKTKTLWQDPWLLQSMFSFRESKAQQNMSYELLRRMSKNSIISAIIRTRVNQVSAFSTPERYYMHEGAGGLGYKIKLKNKHPKNYTRAENNRATELENFLLKCGSTDPITKNKKEKRPGFGRFLKMVTRDSLNFDQACFEKVRSNKGELIEFWPVDSSTIRLANIEDDAAYVQVISGLPKVAFYFNEMGFFVRNPRTDLKANGYGYSELEDLINTVTSHLYAEGFNQKIFSQGTSIKGILNLKGDVPEDDLKAFRAAWKQMTSGIGNTYRTPVLSAKEGAEFINFNGTNKEMEYSKWMEYLIKIACAIFQIDPSEINFDIAKGQSGQKPMFEAGQEARLKSSKDKGLRPLLKDISTMITEEIIEDIDPDWMHVFTGIDSKSEDEIVSLRAKELASYKTLDEGREEAGLDPIGEEKGGTLILNPQYMQWLVGKQTAEALAGQQGMGGGEQYTEEQGGAYE